MRHRRARHGQEAERADAAPGFATLLYRYLFFDWLFADMSTAGNLFERHARWQHNRAMRIHLPLYLWRWAVLAALDIALGCLFERWQESDLMAAWFFASACVMLSGMTVISVLWLCLSHAKLS